MARNASCRYLAALCLVKQSKYDEALGILGDKNPVNLISRPGGVRRKLQQVARTNQNGGAKESKHIRLDRSEDRILEPLESIRAEAAMCYLRGLCHAKQNAFDRAKSCYKDAVRIDVQCFEAFDALMSNSLLSPQEEWDFIEELDFDSIIVGDGSDLSASQEAAAFTKLLYTTRLSKYSHPTEFSTAIETLSTHYSLSTNPDILLARASLLFTQCRFRDALDLTTSILDTDPYNFQTLPVHLASLHELNDKNALYLLSHNLADTHPQEPATHLAIGVYYLTINQIASARRFFSKASILDPHYGPAWIGFAHTFAAEGEHDQAISAYSTAARLFQGTHLPSLFLGMQNIQLANLKLAREYLSCAYDLCRSDPLLLNELGVIAYHESALPNAVTLFKQSLSLASSLGADPKAYLSTRSNLAHAYRRLGMHAESLAHFSEVLRLGGKDAAVFSAKGLVLLEMGEYESAAAALHEALGVSPQDPIATDLLGKAMEGVGRQGFGRVGGDNELDDEERFEGVLRMGQGGGRERRRRRVVEMKEGEGMVLDEDE